MACDQYYWFNLCLARLRSNIFGEVLSSRLCGEKEEERRGSNQVVPDILMEVAFENEVVKGGVSSRWCKGG
jgi:hypothetical protein